jgi:hypothetical protein
LVALLAGAFLRESWKASIYAALVLVPAGLILAITASSVRPDAGVPFITAATLLFAVSDRSTAGDDLRPAGAVSIHRNWAGDRGAS